MQQSVSTAKMFFFIHLRLFKSISFLVFFFLSAFSFPFFEHANTLEKEKFWEKTFGLVCFFSMWMQGFFFLFLFFFVEDGFDLVVGWLVGWMVGWLAGWLVGWLAGR